MNQRYRKRHSFIGFFIFVGADDHISNYMSVFKSTFVTYVRRLGSQRNIRKLTYVHRLGRLNEEHKALMCVG
jgi:hypothetical protein